jgi:hypothetical protein
VVGTLFSGALLLLLRRGDLRVAEHLAQLMETTFPFWLCKRQSEFRRLPRLVWSPQSEDIVPSDVQPQHPALAKDFKTLQDELLPHFRELNADALRYQNEFRLDQVMLILGGALA